MSGSVDRLSVWAVRYALGRATYAVFDVVDVLVAEREHLTANSRAVICQDIDEADRKGRLGMEMDATQWRRLRAALLMAAAGLSDAEAREEGWPAIPVAEEEK